MKNKTYKITLLFFLGITHLFAQPNSRATGLVLDDEGYRNTAQLPQYSGAKFFNPIRKISLRDYCPKIGNQLNTQTCVGFAVGYAALTIQRNIRFARQSFDLANQSPFSAYFLYNKSKKATDLDCSEGISLTAALKTLQKDGDCTVEKFGNEAENCAKTPPQYATAEAQQFAIKDYAAIFKTDDKADFKIKRLRQFIASGNPVVVGLTVKNSFFTLKNERNWQPKPDDADAGESAHALTVIGYDDDKQEFELMNSWGRLWGDAGFVFISYKNLAEQLRYGYVLNPDDRILMLDGKPMRNDDTAQLTAALQNSERFIKLSGVFDWQILPNCDVNTPPQYPTVFFNEKTKQYETQKKDWKSGATCFRFLTKNVPRGKYVYIFNTDAKQKTETIFPENTNDYANFMPSADAEILIPSDESALSLSKKGEDFTAIIFSDRPITDFSKRLKNHQSATGSFQNRLKVAFGDILIDEKYIKTQPNALQFESLSPDGKGFAVALTLMVRGK